MRQSTSEPTTHQPNQDVQCPSASHSGVCAHSSSVRAAMPAATEVTAPVTMMAALHHVFARGDKSVPA